MVARRRPRRARGIGRLAAVLAPVLVGALAWGAGLVWFIGQVPREPAAITGPVEAIVVLTGGLGRLDEGLDLLRANPGAQMFVSGVYRGVDVAELMQIDRETPEALACCVALGHDAVDTRGNARESAAWVRDHGFRTVHLVTGNYHMPRSLLEFRSAMPEVTIVAHPIIAQRVRLAGWWYRPGTAALLASEYTKYLAARVLSP